MDAETRELVEWLREHVEYVFSELMKEKMEQIVNIIEALSKENADLKSYIKEHK